MNIEYGKTYLYEEIKEIVRERQIEILDAVVTICEKHNLEYWLDGGTLLGAIRHKGFIPWDDDIDIGLMRKEYNRLILLLKTELPKHLVVQSRETDSQYNLPFVKIRDKYSKIENDYIWNGIFIDIFPFDSVPNNTLLQKLQRILFMVFEAMYIHTDISKLNIDKNTSLKAKALKMTMKLFASLGKLLGDKSYNYIYNKILAISKISPSNLFGDGMTASWAYYKSIRPKEVYLPVKQAEFEGKLYSVPNDTDSYLKTLYGDNYMTPLKIGDGHIGTVVFYDPKGKI